MSCAARSAPAWDGFKIVEFGAGAAGPIATRYFAEHGATVVRVESAKQSLQVMQAVFGDEACPAREVVIMNAGAAIYASGVADSLEDGVTRARESIDSGAAADRLEKLVATSNAERQ